MIHKGRDGRVAIVILLAAIKLTIGPPDASAQANDEAAVKIHVEGFLAAMGDGDLDALPAMFAANANIGTASLRNGAWVTSTMTFERWMTSLRERTTWESFREPVSEFTVFVEDSTMAFVRADATLLRGGQARSHNIDYFTLVRENGAWKFLSASYVAKPIEPD
jgi:hypothetical protein